MTAPVNVTVRRREAYGEAAWGLYLPDEERWIEILFRSEREAIRFAAEVNGPRAVPSPAEP